MNTPVMPDSSKDCSSACLSGGPLVGVAGARCHQPCHRPARHGADGLHQHLQIVTIGEAPQDLADIVSGQGA